MKETTKKMFDLGDVLSITANRLVSPRGMDGLYEILNFMTGDNIFTHQLPRASNECRPWLIRQYPWLDDPDITTLWNGRLTLFLEGCKTQHEREMIILGMVSELAAKYGQQIEVERIPRDAHDYKDPIAELGEMMGGLDRVIVVESD